MLQKHVLDNSSEIRKELLKPYTIIENAFDPDFAEALLNELNNSRLWSGQDHKTNKGSLEKQSADFTYSRKQINIDSPDLPEVLQLFFNYLNSDECINWINDISGKECSSFWGGAAAFNEGDHISEHDDRYIYTDSNGSTTSRSVTLTYYLNKFWDPKWGGELIWKKPKALIIPEFNKLVLFNVNAASNHLVAPVEQSAVDTRYSVTGWFLTKRSQEMLAKKKPKFKII